jgi:hypothetical protein
MSLSMSAYEPKHRSVKCVYLMVRKNNYESGALYKLQLHSQVLFSKLYLLHQSITQKVRVLINEKRVLLQSKYGT